MKARKIGIVTIFSIPNYGAVLQTYALQKQFRNMGVASETIDYRPGPLEADYAVKIFPRPRMNAFVRNLRFNAFRRRHLAISSRRTDSYQGLLAICQQYDAVLAGSDQLWAVSLPQGYDPGYFLEGIHRPRYSYAASMGGDSSFGDANERVKVALGEFKSLSVRDMHTQQVVADITGCQAVVSVDPTLLVDFDELNEQYRKRVARIAKTRYLLAYGMFSPSIQKQLTAYAQRAGLKLIAVDHPIEGADMRVARIGPGEWYSLFANAQACVTSYFHGTLIAIKCNRPFLSIPTSGRVTKVRGVLSLIGLEDRLVTGDTCNWDMLESLDTLFEPKLKAMVDASVEYLQAIVSDGK